MRDHLDQHLWGINCLSCLNFYEKTQPEGEQHHPLGLVSGLWVENAS